MIYSTDVLGHVFLGKWVILIPGEWATDFRPLHPLSTGTAKVAAGTRKEAHSVNPSLVAAGHKLLQAQWCQKWECSLEILNAQENKYLSVQQG